MAELIALAVTPSVMARWVRRLWDDDVALLPLAPELDGEALDRVLGRLRPARIGRCAPDGQLHLHPRPGARPVPDGTALVATTSGSTGRPRGVLLSHAAVAAATRASVDRLGCGVGEPWLTCLPTHHVAGLQTLLRSWERGAEPVVHDRFDVDDVRRAPAAHVSLVPTQLQRLLDAGADVARFHTILLGGAAPAPALLARAREAGARVVVSYGMTETCGGCVYDGTPLDGVDVSLDPTGRIRVRGPVLLSGYQDAPGPPTDPDGWFTSSDVGRWDPEGRLEVVGRADDVVITGGENVPLEAVAAALRTHPAVVDATAVGRPDPEWGTVVVAVVVPRRPQAPPTLASLRAHVRAQQPAHFAPRDLAVVEDIPRSALGKIVRDELADRIGPGAGRR